MQRPLIQLTILVAFVLAASPASSQIRVLHFGNRITAVENYITMDRVDRILNAALDSSGKFSVAGYAETMQAASANRQPKPGEQFINISIEDLMKQANAAYGITGDLRRFGRLLIHDVLVQSADSLNVLIEGYGYAVADDSSMSALDSASKVATMRGIAAAFTSLKPYANNKNGPGIHPTIAVALLADPTPSDTTFASRMLEEALDALDNSGKIVLLERELLQQISDKANAGTVVNGVLTPQQAKACSAQRINATLQAAAAPTASGATVTFKWVVVAADGLTYDVGTSTCTTVKGKDNAKAFAPLITDALKVLNAKLSAVR